MASLVPWVCTKRGLLDISTREDGRLCYLEVHEHAWSWLGREKIILWLLIGFTHFNYDLFVVVLFGVVFFSLVVDMGSPPPQTKKNV